MRSAATLVHVHKILKEQQEHKQQQRIAAQHATRQDAAAVLRSVQVRMCSVCVCVCGSVCGDMLE